MITYEGLGLSNLTKLRTLNLQWTLSYGNILSEFCHMKELSELDLSYNHVDGTLPTCLGNLTALRKLDVSNNYLIGNPPPSLISNLRSLEHISFDDNMLDGSRIFTSLANHKSQFDYLGFSNCKLNASTDHLLHVLHNQHKLKGIKLSHNNIHGNFPYWLIRNNTKLENLFLRNNSLKSNVHFAAGNPTSFQQIDISMNQLHGKLQTNLGSILNTLSNMKQIESLDLFNNRLTGEIPTDITAITTLEVFTVAYNDLSGRVPDRKAQFATFDETSYEGNSLLCGSPLPKQCGTSSRHGF